MHHLAKQMPSIGAGGSIALASSLQQAVEADLFGRLAAASGGGGMCEPVHDVRRAGSGGRREPVSAYRTIG